MSFEVRMGINTERTISSLYAHDKSFKNPIANAVARKIALDIKHELPDSALPEEVRRLMELAAAAAYVQGQADAKR